MVRPVEGENTERILVVGVGEGHAGGIEWHDESEVEDYVAVCRFLLFADINRPDA
jgi:hypothetical protein